MKVKIPYEIEIEDEMVVGVFNKALEKHPDYVMVVRCKDCKHLRKNGAGYYCEQHSWCEKHYTCEDDFCSYGERKEVE